MSDPRRKALPALALVLLSLTPRAARGDEPSRLALEATGRVEVAGEGTLDVEGVSGTISFEPGPAGELQFRSRRRDSTKVDAPIEVWLAQGRFVLRAPEGTAAVPRVLQVWVPADFRVRVKAQNSDVTASGLTAGIEVEGDADRVEVSSSGSLRADVRGGKVVASTIQGSVWVTGKDLDVRLSAIRGNAITTLQGGSLQVQDGRSLDADLDGTTLHVHELAERLELQAQGADVRLKALRGDSVLFLTGAPAVLEDLRGDVEIQTDAEVRFTKCEAALHIESIGANVRGADNAGLVEVRTSDAEVQLERIAGPVRVEGDGLELALSEIGGETLAYVTRSRVRLREVGVFAVENEGGDVHVTNASGKGRVAARGGDVVLRGLRGPMQVTADGPQVVVAWTEVPREGDSRVVNDGGDVMIGLPRNGGLRLEFETKAGRVDNRLQALQTVDRGSSTAGILGAGSRPRPLLQVEAYGDVVVDGASVRGNEAETAPDAPEPAEEKTDDPEDER